MKKDILAIISAGLLATVYSAVAYADNPRPGHNNTEMFQQIDKSDDSLQANSAEALNKIAPAAGGQFSWNHCQKDIAKFCGDSKGNAAISTCLQDHHSSLSGKCDDATSAYERYSASQQTK